MSCGDILWTIILVAGVVGLIITVLFVLYWVINTLLTYLTGTPPGFWVVLAIIIVIVVLFGVVSGE